MIISGTYNYSHYRYNKSVDNISYNSPYESDICVK